MKTTKIKYKIITYKLFFYLYQKKLKIKEINIQLLKKTKWNQLKKFAKKLNLNFLF